MSKIPNDIVNRLKKDYPNPNDSMGKSSIIWKTSGFKRKLMPSFFVRKMQDALDVVNHVKNDTLNVGWIQLVRSMIILAEGDIKAFKNIKRNGYMGDPRDVIMTMMGKIN